MTLRERAQSLAMTDEGDSVRERRLRLGVPKLELARLAGVDRGTLANIEEGGSYRRESFKSVLEALAQLEEEAGVHARPGPANNAGIIEFEVSGDGGYKVVVRGPITNAEDLERSVARIVGVIRGEAKGQAED